MSYFIYILHSISANKYYVGSSEDPQRRLLFHNTIEKGFTLRYRPWTLVFTKSFPTKAETQQMERKIKKWKSKSMLLRIINGDLHL
ncbi:MAG: GIY-YIG nuclease family protein [Bacteroidota bacterium]